MSINDLINAAKKMVISDEHIQSVEKRLKENEQALEAQAKNQAVNKEFLSRTYSL